MEWHFETLVLFIALGSAAGFLGGLIGIGGGFILVPGLYYAFVQSSLAPGHELPLVLGTTMAAILFTAASAVRTHLSRGVVRLDVVRRFAVWICAGAFLGSVLATSLSTTIVKLAFAIYCLYSGARMLVFPNAVGGNADVRRGSLAIPGTIFGTVCGLTGVGGANLFVPFLLKRSLDMRHAMATASALQMPIALIGSLAYIVLGAGKQTPAGALGFVYLPALVVVAASSVACAPAGARLAHRLPIATLKKVFGAVAAVVGLNMSGAVAWAAGVVRAL